MTDFPSIENLQDRFTAILDEVISIKREQNHIRAIISDLESKPITDAREHWRADRNGEYTILELLHSTDSQYFHETGRRREYIGKDPAKIAAAREARERHNEIARAKGLWKTTDDKIRGILRYFERLEYFAIGKQSSFLGEGYGDVGTSENGGDITGPASEQISRNASPQDMSPQDVADYFRDSEALKPHYQDLRKSPAFSEVNFNQG